MTIAGTDQEPSGRAGGAGVSARRVLPLLLALGAAAAALVFLAPDRHGALVDEATLFANRVRAARDAAVVDGRPVRLRLAPVGYAFAERSGTRWWPMAEDGLRPRRWRPGIVVGIAAPAGRASVVLGAAGSADREMTVSFAHPPDVLRVVIGTDGQVRIDG